MGEPNAEQKAAIEARRDLALRVKGDGWHIVIARFRGHGQQYVDPPALWNTRDKKATHRLIAAKCLREIEDTKRDHRLVAELAAAQGMEVDAEPAKATEQPKGGGKESTKRGTGRRK